MPLRLAGLGMEGGDGKTSNSHSYTLDLHFQASLIFLQKTHDTAHAPPALQSSPQTSRGDPQIQTAPSNSHGNRQSSHLCLSNPPSLVLPAPHYSLRLSEEVRSKARENAFARSLPVTRPVTETKAQGGGRWVGRQEEGSERDGGNGKKGLGRGGRNGEWRKGPGPRSRAAWRGRSLTCPGRCRC